VNFCFGHFSKTQRFLPVGNFLRLQVLMVKWL
jgi:hypothetical protein